LNRKRRKSVDGEREREMQLRLTREKNKDDKEVVVSDALDGKIVRDLNGALKCLLRGDDAVVGGEGEKGD
jgi:hypothetical protein